MSGILYGVSVGPGDPELLTLKAIRTMEKCPVIATPQTGGEKTLALDIAKGAVDLEGKEILI
ncbi:MAG: SAM-dependent methyltransferase, partial [Eubacteriales bacterium]